jgi:Holliday junction DNA helicase RuvA
MIAHLTGVLIDKQPGGVILDVGGVGYQVTIPLSTFYELGDPGSRVSLHIHTHVREDTLALFGFRTPIEKAIFGRLIATSGVGPKTAIAVLSGLGPDEVVEAVRGRDVARLASVPGIGRKTAERIVLDLADRIEALGIATPGPGGATVATPRQDLISALVNLGYNPRVAAQEADRALKEAGPGPIIFQDLLRRSLRSLSR